MDARGLIEICVCLPMKSRKKGLGSLRAEVTGSNSAPRTSAEKRPLPNSPRSQLLPRKLVYSLDHSSLPTVVSHRGFVPSRVRLIFPNDIIASHPFKNILDFSHGQGLNGRVPTSLQLDR